MNVIKSFPPRSTWALLLLATGLSLSVALAWLLRHGPDALAAGMALLGGSAISLLLAGLVLVICRQQDEAARLAEAMVADLRASEARLRESEYRAKFALEGSELGLWDFDVAAGTLFLSPRWKELLGYADDELGNGIDEWTTRVHPDDYAEVMVAISDYLAGRRTLFTSNHRLRCKDGSYRWVSNRGMVVARDASGRPQRMLGTIADIHARKMLALEREKYVRLFTLASEPMVIATGDGRLLSANAAFCRVLGVGEDELRDRPLVDTLHEDERAHLATLLRDATHEGPMPEFEGRHRHRDGHDVLLSWNIFLDRENALVFATGRDITARRQAEARVERLGRLYAALSACNGAIVRCESREELYAEICQIIVRFGGIRMAWIGAIDRATQQVRPVQAFGSGTDYLQDIGISIDAGDARGRGPVGTAGRENHPVWMQDLAAEASYSPWRERAAHYGWQGLAALPVCQGGVPVAVLAVYVAQTGFFDEETRKLLVEMAGDIGYALDKLDAEAESEASRTGLEEAEQRFRALIEQAVAGAFIVQRGTLVYANPRFAQICGHDDPATLVGGPALDLAAPEERGRLQTHVARLYAHEETVLHLSFSLVRRDGSRADIGTSMSLATYRGRPALIGLAQDMSDRKVAEDQVRRYADKLEELLLQTVGMVTTLSDLRDPYTAGHERRVSRLAVAIGEELGLRPDTLEGLRIAGLLHDVGNMMVPAEILSRPGALSATEFGIIQEHCQAGHDVLKDVAFPWPVAEVALQHHERLDGSGYPRGLKGDAILLEARIIAVADVVESMSSHRPFRPALGLEAALAEIRRGSGTRYDADVVAACQRLFREKGFSLAHGQEGQASLAHA